MNKNFIFFVSVKDNSKLRPKLFKKRIGVTVSFKCSSTKDTKWFFFQSHYLLENTQKLDNDNTIVINNIILNNSGLYNCYGYDESLKRHFVATAEVIPIGKS